MNKMNFKIVILVLVIVVVVSSEYRQSQDYIRIKRAKYYSSPPQRFYRRPPFSFPTNGVFSHTPPPGYNDDEDPQQPNHRQKVSKKPHNEGLGEEDINNMVKYLSKQDLDKIIEAAQEKDKINSKYIDNKVRSHDKYSPDVSPQYDTNQNIEPKFEQYKFIQRGPPERQLSKREESMNFFAAEVKELENKKIPINNAYGNLEEKPYVIEYANRDSFMKLTTPPSIIFATPQPFPIANKPLDGAETSNPFNFVNTYIHNELNSNNEVPDTSSAMSTHEMMEPEKTLPKPVNLREDDYEVSYTNNVPTVTKSESYRIENFGSLPVMDYTSSKLHSVSSYHVPRYTITSSQSAPAPSKAYLPSNSAPPIEPAPPASSAKAQSDAHLKAVKIWTHRSKGTAYTLHNDGSLSLERPTRPKTSYGPP